jgi:hypothetical protein
LSFAVFYYDYALGDRFGRRRMLDRSGGLHGRDAAAALARHQDLIAAAPCRASGARSSALALTSPRITAPQRGLVRGCRVP